MKGAYKEGLGEGRGHGTSGAHSVSLCRSLCASPFPLVCAPLRNRHKVTRYALNNFF